MGFTDQEIINAVISFLSPSLIFLNYLGNYIESIFRQASTVLKGTFSTTKCTRIM